MAVGRGATLSIKMRCLPCVVRVFLKCFHDSTVAICTVRRRRAGGRVRNKDVTLRGWINFFFHGTSRVWTFFIGDGTNYYYPL